METSNGIKVDILGSLKDAVRTIGDHLVALLVSVIAVGWPFLLRYLLVKRWPDLKYHKAWSFYGMMVIYGFIGFVLAVYWSVTPSNHWIPYLILIVPLLAGFTLYLTMIPYMTDWRTIAAHEAAIRVPPRGYYVIPKDGKTALDDYDIVWPHTGWALIAIEDVGQIPDPVFSRNTIYARLLNR